LPGIISLCIYPGLNLSVDFTGGTIWKVEFNQAVDVGQVRNVMAAHGYGDSIVQSSGTNGVIIRSKELQAASDTKNAISADLRAKFGEFTEPSFQSVGPTVGSEIAERAVWAVAAAALGILLYIWWAFRKVPKSIRYGTCAVIALVHDALLVLGVFSIAGKLFNIEIDSLFITALLTVIGFSVHDTIVVFDRIRENMGKEVGVPYETVVNHSVLQTLGRSLNTSLTVIITLSALVLFGGVTIRIFAMTLLIGIISGTYSSIFNASALLVSWEKGEFTAPFRKLFGSNSAAPKTVGN
jgi:preprotein translocase subunit SecF